MKKVIYLLLVILFASNTIYAQNPLNIVDSPDKVIKVNGVPITGIRENSISTDNLRPTTLITGHNVGDLEAKMYTSNIENLDNWNEISFSPRLSSCDPTVFADQQNNYYCVFLDDRFSAIVYPKIKLIKKTQYSTMSYIIDSGQGLDKPYGWIDNNNNIYVSYVSGLNLFMKKSTDLGQTWTSIDPITTLLGEQNELGSPKRSPNIKTGKNSEVYLSWAAQYLIGFNAYIDGSWNQYATTVTTNFSASNLYGYPCLEVNSNNTDQIFCVYTKIYDNAQKVGVFFQKSNNNGNSWSDPPVEINPNYATYKIKPWITYNNEYNSIFCVFYSRISVNPDRYKTFISYSTDDGDNWSEDIPISDTSYPLFQYTFSNEYIGITSKYGKIYPIWSDDREDGQYRAYVSPLYIHELFDSQIKNNNENILSIYPNPFNPITEIKYKVSSSENVKMSIYDLSGKEIETLVNENKMPGEYHLIFDGSKLSSGVYFCKLSIGNKIYSNKIVILK